MLFFFDKFFLLYSVCYRKEIYRILEGVVMKEYRRVIINKCLRICIMFCPILLWNIYLCLQCFLSFPKDGLRVVSSLILLCLIITILFGNSFIEFSYNEEREQLYFEIRRPTQRQVINNILSHFPVLFCIFLPILFIYMTYILVQIFYMYVDKRHFTMVERLLFTLKNKVKKGESVLA